MNNRISINEFALLVCEALEESGEVTFSAIGRSMLPLIRDKKDKITIIKAQKMPKEGDVALYRRDNGQLVLSRIMFVNNGTFVMRGDNQWDNEYNVSREQIVGILKSFERDGKIHNIVDRDYLLYVKFLPLIRFLRKTFYGIKSRVYKFVKYLLKK